MGLRLDQYLVRRMPRALSRALIQRIVRDGAVTVGGKPSKVHRRLRNGEIVCAQVKELPDPHASAPLPPQHIPISIVYEDPHMLIVNKPPGLVTHPAPGHWDGTLVNAILWHLEQGPARHPGPPLTSAGAGGSHERRAVGTMDGGRGLPRAGIVHRLDKDTSGLLLVAKTPTAHTALAKQLETREIRRRYYTLVEGHVPLDVGTLSASIGRHAVHRKTMAVRYIGGRMALTQYRVVRRFGKLRMASDKNSQHPAPNTEPPFPYTLLDISLGTGRTHQIRVHTAHLGYPVLGDTTYGHRPASFWQSVGIARQMLHAYQLSFQHPVRGDQRTVTAPIPEDMAKWLVGGNLTG